MNGTKRGERDGYGLSVGSAHPWLLNIQEPPAQPTAAPQLPLAEKANQQGLEAYGLYKIGEILGRRHLIGYNVPANAVGQH